MHHRLGVNGAGGGDVALWAHEQQVPGARVIALVIAGRSSHLGRQLTTGTEPELNPYASDLRFY